MGLKVGLPTSGHLLFTVSMLYSSTSISEDIFLCGGLGHWLHSSKQSTLSVSLFGISLFGKKNPPCSLAASRVESPQEHSLLVFNFLVVEDGCEMATNTPPQEEQQSPMASALICHRPPPSPLWLRVLFICPGGGLQLNGF